MAHVKIEEIKRTIVKNHPIKGTEKITFNYEIINSNKIIASNVFTVTVNDNGVKYDITKLKNQIPDSKLLRLLITTIRIKNWHD